MPRKVYRKRRTYKKKTTLAKKVNNLTKMVRANKPELKYSWNYGLSTVDNNPTFNIVPYRSITVGTGDLNNRIGDDICVKKIHVKGWLAMPATLASSMVRVFAFVYKHNPDAITTTYSTIVNLYLESTTMNTYQAPLAFTDWDNHASFATLYDKLVPVNATDSSVNYVKPLGFTLSIPKKYQNVEYAAGGVYPTRNELIIGAISDTDTSIQWAYAYRFSYTDA